MEWKELPSCSECQLLDTSHYVTCLIIEGNCLILCKNTRSDDSCRESEMHKEEKRNRERERETNWRSLVEFFSKSHSVIFVTLVTCILLPFFLFVNSCKTKIEIEFTFFLHRCCTRVLGDFCFSLSRIYFRIIMIFTFYHPHFTFLYHTWLMIRELRFCQMLHFNFFFIFCSFVLSFFLSFQFNLCVNVQVENWTCLCFCSELNLWLGNILLLKVHMYFWELEFSIDFSLLFTRPVNLLLLSSWMRKEGEKKIFQR